MFLPLRAFPVFSAHEVSENHKPQDNKQLHFSYPPLPVKINRNSPPEKVLVPLADETSQDLTDVSEHLVDDIQRYCDNDSPNDGLK